MKLNDELRSVCDDIELMTGIKTVIFDEERKLIQSQPEGMCKFCSEIRKSKALTKRCFACDAYGFNQCEKTHDISVYRCHMGLIEAIAPISDGGRTVGYMMLGQILPLGERETVRKKIDSLGCEVDRGALYSYLDAMTETDEKSILAAARILAMSAAYVRANDWLERRKSTTAYKIERYVYENIGNESLSATDICSALGLSRTALYNICKKSFGVGIGEYIRRVRCDEAIRLLKASDIPVFLVADRVGLSISALGRVLKSREGLTAKEIRRASVSRIKL